MDWNKLMTDLADLEKRVIDHDARDDEQFRGLRDSLAEIKARIVEMAVGVTECTSALIGSNTERGLRERIRTLEDREQDRKWAMRILWAAVIGEAVVLSFRIFTMKGLP